MTKNELSSLPHATKDVPGSTGDIELKDVSTAVSSRNRVDNHSAQSSGYGQDSLEDDEFDGPSHELLRGSTISSIIKDDKESFNQFTLDEERNVVQKFDRHLILFLALLYMLSFLDRSSKWISQSFSRLMYI